MLPANNRPVNGNTLVRCAIYTRKSTEEGLEQSFNTLDAQRDAAEAYISSQRHGDGSPCQKSMTMAVTPAPTWTGPR